LFALSGQRHQVIARHVGDLGTLLQIASVDLNQICLGKGSTVAPSQGSLGSGSIWFTLSASGARGLGKTSDKHYRIIGGFEAGLTILTWMNLLLPLIGCCHHSAV
jgi:hypothetical protein